MQTEKEKALQEAINLINENDYSINDFIEAYNSDKFLKILKELHAISLEIYKLDNLTIDIYISKRCVDACIYKNNSDNSTEIISKTGYMYNDKIDDAMSKLTIFKNKLNEIIHE